MLEKVKALWEEHKMWVIVGGVALAVVAFLGFKKNGFFRKRRR
jgi:hypothetical protein